MPIKSIENLDETRLAVANHMGIRVEGVNSGLSRSGNEYPYNEISAYCKYLSIKQTDIHNDGNVIQKVEAMSAVMLSVLAEIIENQKGQMSSAIKNELEKIVNESLDVFEK